MIRGNEKKRRLELSMAVRPSNPSTERPEFKVSQKYTASPRTTRAT